MKGGVVMRNAMLVVAIVAASWAGAFGVALGVTEWRGDAPTTLIADGSRCQMWEEQLLIASRAGGTNEDYYDWMVGGIATICRAEGLQSPFD